MARRTTVTIYGQEFILQSVSPTWYMDNSDEHGMSTGRKHTSKYADALFKNCVISPAEIKVQGMKYFDEREDIASAGELLAAIETFLKSREQPVGSTVQSTPE